MSFGAAQLKLIAVTFHLTDQAQTLLPTIPGNFNFLCARWKRNIPGDCSWLIRGTPKKWCIYIYIYFIYLTEVARLDSSSYNKWGRRYQNGKLSAYGSQRRWALWFLCVSPSHGALCLAIKCELRLRLRNAYANAKCKQVVVGGSVPHIDIYVCIYMYM